ncbi:hypothetical protein PspLS_09734 [Pyricularia sp. CBS 133598]|nr:hypothetical protein PspLS_09734 [Pyricularia sp. CBS 133598]
MSIPIATIASAVLSLRGLAWVAFTFLVSYCIYSLHLEPLLSPLRHLPAPKQGFLWFRLLKEPKAVEIERWMDELPHDGLFRYYGIFNRQRIFAASPEATADLLHGPNASKYVKPKLQFILANNIAGKGLLIQEGEENKHARRGLAPAFSPDQMRSWFPEMWKTAVETIEALPDHTDKPALGSSGNDSTGVVELLKLISAASIDMIGHFAYSTDFKAIQMNGPKHKRPLDAHKSPKSILARAYVEMFKTTWRGQRSLEAASLIGASIALALPLRAVKTIKSIMALVWQVSEDIVTEHERVAVSERKHTLYQDNEKTLASTKTAAIREDMLSVAMRSRAFSHRDLVTQTVHFLAAGTETVAGSASWAVHLLSRHPEMQTRLRDEVRAAIPDPNMPQQQAKLRALSYLGAVVQEVLRYHSINTLLWRKCVDPMASEICGVHIPKGTVVVFSPWAMNRDPKSWGPDARTFNPDRWLVPADQREKHRRHPCSFLTFGSGPRRCPGEPYARDELLCLIASLVGRYHFSPLRPEAESDEGQEIGDDFALTLFKIYEGWRLNVTRIPGW